GLAFRQLQWRPGAGIFRWPFDGAVGIVSNPPFTLAEQFVRRAIAAAPYSAWLLRLNWLEGCARKRLFDEFPPARIRVSSRRLPFHRLGYTGPKAASNCRARRQSQEEQTTQHTVSSRVDNRPQQPDGDGAKVPRDQHGQSRAGHTA